ncbi:MAG: apolipoprotein N-acyltransferase [Bacteroidales bacterium]|jgi:apolipoprotein N-acyltransferase|nr:apolipoprotein N-acyltransferase [Bacteroidales bacterium]
MSKRQLLLLSLLSGLILSLAWPRDGFPVLMFLGFIPFLLIEDYISRHRENFHRFAVMVYTYPGFLLWNVLTTFWIWNSTEIGSLGAFLANAFFMALIFNLYSYTKRHIYGKNHGYFILPFYWISFEYWHLNWDMSWPWLNLGNAFASYPSWVQWYEFTGAFGGTLWVLVLNILLYRLILLGWNKGLLKDKVIWGTASGLLFFVPLAISLYTYNSYEEVPRPVEVIVTQANINPYTEQYTLPPREVVDRNIKLASEMVTDETDFVVSPESSIQEPIWEHNYNASPSLREIRRFIADYPKLTFIIGASTFKEYFEGEEISYTARKFRDADGYYDAYNTVFFIDNTGEYEVYHKSKLTPGVEKMPFPQYLGFLENFAIDLGGTVGSLGTDDIRKVFVSPDDSLRVSAVICYESVYGEFFAGFARNGAELIFIVTNDGWWGSTPGHRQHFSYARLRAVETRRSIARSANTGISAFINQRGDVLQESDYWVPAVLKDTINANDSITFYSKYGDYLARISAFVAVLLLLIAISISLRNRKKLTVG